MLPVDQVRKGQTWPANLLIAPHPKVLQGHLGGHAGLKAGTGMGPLASATTGMLDVLVARLDDLTPPSRPAAPSRGLAVLAMPLRRAKDLGPIAGPPARMRGLPFAALIAALGA
jgi:hypothetical protein